VTLYLASLSSDTVVSAVNRDIVLKAKVRTKDLTRKAQARTKDKTLKAKVRTKDQSQGQHHWQ